MRKGFSLLIFNFSLRLVSFVNLQRYIGMHVCVGKHSRASNNVKQRFVGCVASATDNYN